MNIRRLIRPLPWLAGIWACYWIALFISTHIPRLPGVDRPAGMDKLAHFLGYAGLALLTGMVLLRGRRWSPGAALAVLAGLMLYGVIDELLQIPIPHRTADLLDWVCDALGAAAGIAAFRVVQKMFESRRLARGRASQVALEQV